MNVTEIMDAWKQANEHDTYSFYERFHQLTGLYEDEVKRVFQEWKRTRGHRVEEIATKHGVTVREGGFQAFLAERFWPEDTESKTMISVARYLRSEGLTEGADKVDHILDCKARLGRVPLAYITVDGPIYGQGDPRAGKDWPPEEDCPGCPGRAGPDGPHKMSCSSEWGSKANGRITVPVAETPDGKLTLPTIWGIPVIVSEEETP